MKRRLLVLLILFVLTGCTASDKGLDRAIAFRQRIQSSESCCFDVTICADYDDYVHTFVLRCQWRSGNLDFEVLAPETIAGISGAITSEAGSLSFDNEILAFSPLADGEIPPVAAPWILMKTLESGYLTAVESSEQSLLLCINDSYQTDALRLNAELDSHDLPSVAEVIWQGRRILTMRVENFKIL